MTEAKEINEPSRRFRQIKKPPRYTKETRRLIYFGANIRIMTNQRIKGQTRFRDVSFQELFSNTELVVMKNTKTIHNLK